MTENQVQFEERQNAKLAAGSARLLAALWREHPVRMRHDFMLGRAERVAITENERKIQPLGVPMFGKQLVQSVADDFGISYGELIGEGRTRIYVEARSVVVHVLRQRGWSFPRIGALLNKRDHSTIMHSFDTFDIHANRNPLVAFCYEKYRPQLVAA